MSNGIKISPDERLLTPAEVAQLFRVDPKTVTRWAKAGLIGSIRTLGNHRRYRETEVRALLAGRTGHTVTVERISRDLRTAFPFLPGDARWVVVERKDGEPVAVPASADTRSYHVLDKAAADHAEQTGAKFLAPRASGDQ